MAIPSGMFINKFGYRKGVVLGLILFAIGSFSFIPGVYIGGFNVFLLALFVIGCGLTFLETAANPYVTELGSPQTATSRLNLSHPPTTPKSHTHQPHTSKVFRSCLPPICCGSFLLQRNSYFGDRINLENNRCACALRHLRCYCALYCILIFSCFASRNTS